MAHLETRDEAALERFQAVAEGEDDADSAFVASRIAAELGNDAAARHWLQKAVDMGSNAAPSRTKYMMRRSATRARSSSERFVQR